MILELLWDFALWFFGIICDAVPAAVPVFYNTSSALSAVIDIGVWVIGQDCWWAVMTVVSTWLSFRFMVGTILFVYRLVPFNG